MTYNSVTSNVPKHIAIIADGNRRWAKERGLPSLLGHQKGMENLEALSKKAKDLGVKCITFWAFSTENWKRDPAEVDYLMNLFVQNVTKNKEKFLKENTRFVHLGRKDRLPKKVLDALNDLETLTKDFSEFTVTLALDYGGHDELLRTIKSLQNEGLEINQENIENHLDTRNLPKIDLIIRPGGETRLSGFMSWQCEYAELYFSNKYLPDFSPEELEKALISFSERDRRFGGNSALKKETVSTPVSVS